MNCLKHICRRCNAEAKQSIKELIFSKWNENLGLCPECKENKQWEETSRLECGASTLQLTNGTIKVHKYKPDLYETLSKELSDNRCAVRLRDKSSFVCRVLKVEKGYLICEKEGTDTAIQRIPVHLIDCYVVISEDCYKFDDEFTHRIKGYKAVELVDGVLGTDKFIYEMGIPYTQEKEDPFDAFYGSTYSHFCTKIEDVLGWRETLLSADSEYRLFEVEATGHCFQNTPNGWVYPTT